MESEARQNPLSKVETIEQLRTTIDKLEAIIEQLNSTSVEDLPSCNSVEALITTTEELGNAIAALPQKTVTLEQTEAIAQKTVTKPVTKAQTKPAKPKKKKNWIAIAIIALIVAIIPISLKYLSPGSTQQVLSEKVEEIGEKTVTQEPSIIATKLPDNNLQKNEENPVISEVTEKVENITSSEYPKQQIEAEIVKVATIAFASDSTELLPRLLSSLEDKSLEDGILSQEDGILSREDGTSEGKQASLKTEKIAESDLEKSLVEEETETIIASEDSESEEIAPLETHVASESPSNIDETADEIIDQTVVLETENILEPEPQILVPENLVTEGTTEKLELKTVIHDVKLTPEQKLIAELREKVLQLTEDYQEEIVLSIEPNIANKILIVTITDDWYQLETTEQDEIVADMFARSQKLEFRKLAIKDQNDNLVARSPVVGQNMIIFRRDS